MVSGEPLGSPMPDFPGTPDVEVLDGPDKPFEKPFDKPCDPGHDRKRKRGGLMEEINVFCSMTEAVKEVATTIRECKPLDVHPDLYGAVMTQGGFSDEALMASLSHLLDNKARVLGSLPRPTLIGCCGSGAGWASTTTRVVLPVSVHDPRRRWWWRRRRR